VSGKRRPRGAFDPADCPDANSLSSGQLVALINDAGSLLAALSTEAKYLQHKRSYYQGIVHCREKPEFTVSDHAIVRYLERVLKMDLDRFRKVIAEAARAATHGTGDLDRLERARGDAFKATANGITMIIADRRNVVTCFAEGEEP
jgi:hypothetical protein